MEKEFIPYQEALELKQLGFDEPCFGKWLSSLQSNWKDYELILEMGMNEEFEDNRNVYLLQGACSAPTYSQAFRWFREEHDLDYSLLPESSSGHKLSTRTFNIVIYKYYMNMNVQAKIVRIDGKIARYNKREEAELECLRKLIEIVKQNG
jgi:hypothetical protein